MVYEKDELTSAIKKYFIDWPSSQNTNHNLSQNPPKVSGQIGIPVIVDKILGNISYHLFLKHISNSVVKSMHQLTNLYGP